MRALRGAVGVVALGLVALSVAGCSDGSQPRTQTPATTTATTSAPSTSTVDPNAQQALDAFSAFNAAATEALRNPQTFSTGKDQASDIRPYSFDPIRAQYTAYVMELAYEQVAFRGTAPAPRVQVKSIDLAAKPYPMVVLTNCDTPAPSWREYVVKTGKLVPQANGSVPPPYLLTVEVIYYAKHWGVSKVSADKSRTCTV